MQRHRTDLMAVAAIVGGAVVGLGATMAFGGKHDHGHGHGHWHGKGHSHAVVCETTGSSSRVAVKFRVRDQSGSVTEYRPPRDQRPVRKRRRCRRIVTDVDHQVELRFRADRLHFRTDWGDPDHAGAQIDRERRRARAEALRERAAQLRERAEAARERAAQVRERAAEVRERAGEARERGEEARERAEALRERAAELRERAGEARERGEEAQERAEALLQVIGNGPGAGK